MAMVKGWKIGICALCAFCALALSLPSYASDPTLENHSEIFLAACNAYTDPVKMHTAGSSASVLLPYNEFPSDYTCIIGAKFHSYPDLTYTFNFTLGYGGDTVESPFSVGHYVSNTQVNSTNFLSTNESFFAFMGSSDSAYPCNFSMRGTSSGNSSVIASFTYKETTENENYKTFGIINSRVRNTTGSSGNRFVVLLTDVTVSYNGTLDGAILDKLDQTYGYLDLISGQVSYAINGIDATQQQISDLKNYVGEDGAKTRDTVIKTAEETQQAINEAADQAHKDADRAHQDAENAPDNEYNKGMEKDQELQGDVDDLQNSFDLSDINEPYTDMMNGLWSLLSTTESQTTLNLKKAEVNLDFGGESQYIKFWDSQTIDFEPWLENQYVEAIIVFVKALCLLYLVTWSIEFIYSIISWFLGDTSESIGQIIFGFNVFR